MQHSEAEIAVASDSDLIAIFGVSVHLTSMCSSALNTRLNQADSIPEDITAALKECQPDIEVDESGGNNPSHIMSHSPISNAH